MNDYVQVQVPQEAYEASRKSTAADDYNQLQLTPEQYADFQKRQAQQQLAEEAANKSIDAEMSSLGGECPGAHFDRPVHPTVFCQRRNNVKRRAVNLHGSAVHGLTGNYAATDKQKGVEYLDKAQRSTYGVFTSGGKLKWGKTYCWNENFDTSNLETAFSGKGWAIWVLSLDGIFYSNSHVVDKFHHSSFLSGSAVKCGGEWRVVDGELQCITGKTGHYKSDVTALVYALHKLSLSGLRMDNSEVLLWGKKEENIVDIGDGLERNLGFSSKEAKAKHQAHKSYGSLGQQATKLLGLAKHARQRFLSGLNEKHLASTKRVPVNEFLFNQEYQRDYQSWGETQATRSPT